MPERPLTQTKCHNQGCPALVEMPDSILQRADSYLYRTATGIDSIAVLCDRCKRGYAYTTAEFYGSGMTDTPDPFRNGRLNLFHVYLECENKDCKSLTGAWSPKPAHIEIEDVRAELESWQVHGLVCRCGEVVLSPLQASLRQSEPDS
jgi:hypothetical protein